MFYRRLYFVLHATGYRIFISDVTTKHTMLETVWIANIAAEIYRFDCISFAVRDSKSENCKLIDDMRYALSSLVRSFECYRLQDIHQ